MIVEGLGSVTFVNGVLRIQLTATNPAGQIQETGTIEIPANRINEVINGLVGATQEIVGKVNEAVEEAKLLESKDSEDNNNANGSKEEKSSGNKKKSKK